MKKADKERIDRITAEVIKNPDIQDAIQALVREIVSVEITGKQDVMSELGFLEGCVWAALQGIEA